MAVITISRGSNSYGTTIAEQVAQKLGYKCIGRDVVIEASKEFNLPEIKLLRAVQDAPSILDRFTYGKERYIAYIQAALLKHLKADNVVFHGFAGHFFVKDISHVLKVRINADIEDRARIVMERERVSRKEAIRMINHSDKQRKKWSKHLYGIDTWDSSLYDLVVKVGKIAVEDAVDIICHTARLERFQTTTDSRSAMEDLALSAEVRALLVDMKPDIQVSAQNGIVYVKTATLEAKEFDLVNDIQETVRRISAVKDVIVDVVPIPAHLNHQM